MTQEHGPFIVLSPQPEFFPQGGVLAPRLETLCGKTIAFLDNNKLQPHNRYVEWLGDLLQGREGVKALIHAQKPFFTRPAREEVLKPLMIQADAVVTGVGE
ncbi:MAG TPA: hypothetical protein VLQ80_31150 [Candidatus Saccharimonadia bacterium]|nr:hypothetical protein [Candidatus Saccharimonadia bacterium]